MSEKPYDELSHMEGALRRVYQARKSLSHIDAGTLDGEEFEIVASVTSDLDDLERSLEQRIAEKRRKGEWSWPMSPAGRELEASE